MWQSEASRHNANNHFYRGDNYYGEDFGADPDRGAGAGRLLRAVCCVANGCLAIIGLIAICCSIVAANSAQLPPAAFACCCRPVLPMEGVSLPLICLLAGCLPLTAGVLGLAAAAHRRARLGHAASAIAATFCALAAANVGVLAGASGGADLSELLTACGLLSDASVTTSRTSRVAGAALIAGWLSAILLLGHACLSWSYYYKYASVGAYDGQYSLARVRRRRWQRWRRQQLQHQLLLAGESRRTHRSANSRGRESQLPQPLSALSISGGERFDLVT